MSSVAAVDGLAQGAGFPKFPDEFGHFGTYGGRFVAETLMKPLEELEQAYRRYLNDPLFIAELDKDLHHYVGRPSPLYYAQRWSERLGGGRGVFPTGGVKAPPGPQKKKNLGQTLFG